MNWESRVDIYTLPSAKQMARGKLLYNRQRAGMGDWRGREAQGEGDLCTFMADSHLCTAEINTTL